MLRFGIAWVVRRIHGDYNLNCKLFSWQNARPTEVCFSKSRICLLYLLHFFSFSVFPLPNAAKPKIQFSWRHAYHRRRSAMGDWMVTCAEQQHSVLYFFFARMNVRVYAREKPTIIVNGCRCCLPLTFSVFPFLFSSLCFPLIMHTIK